MKRQFVLWMALGILLASGCGSAKEVEVTAVKQNENEVSVEVANESAEETGLGDAQAEKEDTQATEKENVMSDGQTKTEIPVLRDHHDKTLGEWIGCAVTGSEIDDPKVFEIMTTHFNAVTLGNELKPDAIFGYSNAKCPGLEETELNGVTMQVPRMDFSRAEKILDKIYDWNSENPEKQLKVRGHVLVWHSQTPEWFFHEDYDKEKPYVSSEEMNLRLEWYIKSVLTHFTGEESKYAGMFYGWDVVNEAVSDNGGKYRSENENQSEPLSNDTHGSNSSWWAVYQSEEYIVNAFKYANKYAPENLELYYNDYNECNLVKRNGIKTLLQTVKEQEGAPGEGTRISGMGMQGHYNMTSPGFSDIEFSIKEYSEIVGKVQITELDLTASEDYTGTDESKLKEYEEQRKRYNMICYGIKSAVNTGQDVSFDGITFWGTVDHYSWLQTRSNVGGANTTGLPCCPLLFDENYEPKPCFYVFAGNQ